MHKEIGSEFWDIPVKDEDNHLFNKDTKWFISGRSALDFVIKDIKKKKNIKTALLPSWCCDTVIYPFKKNNIEVKFYPVILEDNKLIKKIGGNADILLNIDYFGYSVKNNIDFDGIIINDITHSIFTKHDEYDYTIGSLRKWAGFKTGGFAWSKDGFVLNEYKNINEDYINLRSNAMIQKKNYIENDEGDKSFLDKYINAEKKLDSLYEFAGSKDDILSANKMDVIFLKEKRKDNANKLLEYVKDYAVFKEVKENDCPLFVPIIIDDRDKLRRYLIEKNIYCPVHWPISNLHVLNKDERYLYNHELSLVCDQRYDPDDMIHIGECIKEYLEKDA